MNRHTFAKDSSSGCCDITVWLIACRSSSQRSATPYRHCYRSMSRLLPQVRSTILLEKVVFGADCRVAIQSLLKPFIVRAQPSQRWYEVVSSVIDRYGANSDTEESSSFLKGLFSRLVTIVLHSARGCEVSLNRLPQTLLPSGDGHLGTGETGRKRKRSEWTEARCASFAALARI